VNRGIVVSTHLRMPPAEIQHLHRKRIVMSFNMLNLHRPLRRPRVVALHCSGAGAGQWSALAEALGGNWELVAPEHFGSESTGPWTGEHAFALADEAARAIALIDEAEDRVHLVGHSYGGGVALHAALARPHRVASLCLYEPSAFHLLRQMGGPGPAAFAEITGVARSICEGVVTGDYRGAATAFVDYWNGRGAFSALRPAVQEALVRWTPKGPLDFRALIDDPTPIEAYRSLDVPTLILRGEHAPAPTRVIAEALSQLMPAARLLVVAGAGHMGPVTHKAAVCAPFVEHIGRVAAAQAVRHWPAYGRSRARGAVPRIARSMP
jgi:pimeloyl-ACP methyl ester carboxylesterase